MLEPVKVEGLAAEVIDGLRRSGLRFKLVQKKSSKLMKFFGFFYRLLGRDFNDYITTVGRTIYWNRESAGRWPDASTIYHESIHVADYDTHPVWFVVSYLFPQLLIPPMLIAASVVGFLSPWWGLVLVGLSVVLFFLPAPWRTRWELRGYAGTLRFQKFYGVRISDIDYYRTARRNFASSAYLWMCPCRVWVAERLKKMAEGDYHLPGWGVVKMEILRHKADIHS